MKTMSRRVAMRATAAGAVAAGTAALGGTARADEPRVPKLWTLEGELKVHPKYLYRYFLTVVGNGQTCGLYGSDHGRESDLLARVQLPARVRVRGVLGTEHHAGGTKEDPSPFPATWLVYMDVHEVETLK
jgi:hypothetical protein